jgi:hypothetical protein
LVAKAGLKSAVATARAIKRRFISVSSLGMTALDGPGGALASLAPPELCFV